METVTKPKTRPLTFVWVGIVLTLINFVIYIILVHTFFQDHDQMPFATAIAYIISAVAAYFMHQFITWKDRQPSRSAMIKFFATNLFAGLVLTPIITSFFLLLTGIYEFAFTVSSALHLSFSLDFITKVGVFGLQTAIVMIFNYIMYNKVVFKGAK
jgi:putative flippase GtrA